MNGLNWKLIVSDNGAEQLEPGRPFMRKDGIRYGPHQGACAAAWRTGRDHQRPQGNERLGGTSKDTELKRGTGSGLHPEEGGTRAVLLVDG